MPESPRKRSTAARSRPAVPVADDIASVVLDTVDAIILVADRDLRMLRFNKGCEMASGYAEAEILGKGIDHLLLKEEFPGIQAVLKELQESGGPNRHENHWRHRDGSLRLISWSNSVVRDATGRTKYIIATGIDITEKRAIELEAQRRMEDLAHMHRLNTAGELATMIAHDINQPLLAINLFCEAALAELERPERDVTKLRQDLGKIASEALRAGRTIQRLRQFVSRGRLEPEPIDLNRLVQEVVELARSRIEARGYRLDTELAADLPKVEAVDVHVEQILLNLVNNAIDALREGAPGRGRIVVATAEREGMAEVTVSDNGIGIKAADIDRLFAVFFTTKKNGLGVGLRICRSLVEAHGGRLWATPLKSGARFHFTLPFAR
jgi:PAS domain S-box-containing protein